MGSYLIYSPTTGIIDRTGGTPDGEEMIQARAGEAVMLTPGPALRGDTYYVDLGPPPVLATKPTMGATINKTFISASGTDIATISSVPPGASAYVDDVLMDGNIADGSVEFTADSMGFYVIRLEHVRYLPQEFRVGAGVIEAPLIVAVDRVRPASCSLPPIRETVPTILPFG